MDSSSPASRVPRTLVLSIVGLVALCLIAAAVDIRDIEHTLPYPQHVDEAAVSTAGARVITTGSFRPDTFNYPSLPKYIAAAGLAAGLLRAASHAEIVNLAELGSVAYPYYDQRRPMETARELFAALAVASLALTGVLAWTAFRQPSSVSLAPLLVVSAPLFAYHSWAYLNVDIVGTFFVMATLVAVITAKERATLVRAALLPGLCAGLATGSKYNLALIAVPVALGILFWMPRARRWPSLIVAAAAMIGAYLAVVPYSVLDLPDFLNGLIYEANHYASGHNGFDAYPGWPQAAYYANHFLTEFGIAGVSLGVIGMVAGLRRDWRLTIVLLAFPLLTLSLLVEQRTHFTRNVLAIEPTLAIFAALGTVVLYRGLLVLVERWPRMRQQPGLRVAAAAFVLLMAVPVSHVRAMFHDPTDSRILARDWLHARVGANWTIVVPRELAFDSRDLERAGLNVRVVDLIATRTPEAAAEFEAQMPSPSIILVPRWGYDRYSPGEKVARALNEVAERWSPAKAFGSEDVNVNHENNVPFGNPAFYVAPLHLPAGGVEWLRSIHERHR